MGVSIPLPADCEPTALPSELIPLTTCTCIFLVYPCEYRQRVRVVKELVLKANGLCPREFKSRRCRFLLFAFLYSFCTVCVGQNKNTQKKIILRSRELNPGLPRDRREY